VSVLAINDIISVGVDSLLNGQQVLLTHHYVITAVTGTAPTVQLGTTSIITAINGAAGLVQKLADTYSNDVLLMSIYAQKIWPIRYVRFSGTPSLDTGSVSGDALPQNVAHAITLRSEFIGADGRGTKHIGGVPSTWSVGGQMTETAYDAYAALADELVDTLTVAVLGGGQLTLKPIAYHRATPSVSALVDNWIISRTTRVMRRRTVGLGT
jgi:hypothetical protein